MSSKELTKELIRYNTVSPVTEKQAFRPLIKLFEENDIEYEIKDIDGVKNLIASKGSGKPHFCFNGHLDVVNADESAWNMTKPFEPIVKEGKLYGRGSADMKGGLASMATAFVNMDDFPGKVSFVVSGDEEIAGSKGTKKLIEGKDIDFAIVGEPTSMDVKYGFRGLLHIDIAIKGDAGHASRPHMAENPMKDAVKAVNLLQDIVLETDIDDFPAPTFEVTRLKTDNAKNVIPGTVKIGVDSRFTPNYSPEQLIKKVEKLLESEEISFEIFNSRSKRSALTEDRLLKQTAKEAVEKQDVQTMFTCEGGSSDGVFFADKNIPFIQLGPKKTSHKSDEHINVEELEKLDIIYQEISEKVLGTKKKQKEKV